VKPLSFIEVQELARAVVAVGDSFCCRRLLQRLDRGELELHEVLVRLSALRPRESHNLRPGGPERSIRPRVDA